MNMLDETKGRISQAEQRDIESTKAHAMRRRLKQEELEQLKKTMTKLQEDLAGM